MKCYIYEMLYIYMYIYIYIIYICMYIYIYIVKKADEKHCHYHIGKLPLNHIKTMILSNSSIDWESAHMVSGWSWLDKSTVVNIIVYLVNILTF